MRCINCDRETANSKFCSHECQKDFEFKERVRLVDQNGKFDPAYGNEVNRRFVRRYLECKHGHRCSICGIEHWNGKDIVLIVDHVDGDQSNFSISNYRLVCPNCDSQLPTFKRRNKNSRRARCGQPRTESNWQARSLVWFHKNGVRRRFDEASEKLLLKEGWIKGFKF